MSWAQPLLQPPDDHPFTNVIAMRVGAGEIRAGDVLPDSVLELPHERTVYLTLGTFFNAAAGFSVPLQALCELPVNLAMTCGYGADP